MTLYLQYRPQSFADVVGQDAIVTTLTHAIEQKKLAHAYLFCGTRGTGKTSIARILAKTILTQDIDDELKRQHIAKSVEDGSLIDLIEIDAASNRRIDDIRDLIEKIQFSPIVSNAKVYIVDEVHMLTKEAFNALLKTLEEPPQYAYFILATTELHKVPETIQSRCQRFLFKRVKDEDVTSRLEYIVDREKIEIDGEALRYIARQGAGSFRDAISLLDQLRSLSKITLLDVHERTGKTSVQYTEEICAIVEKKATADVPAIMEKIEEAAIPLENIFHELLTFLRMEIHEKLQEKQDVSSHLLSLDTLLQALQDIRISPVPSLVLEAALLKLCHEGKTTTLHTTSATSTDTTKKPETANESKNNTSNIDKKKTVFLAEECTLDTILKHWNTIVQKTTPAHVRMSLKNASVKSIEDNKLTLSFESASHKEKVAETQASRTIESILYDIFKKEILLECIVGKKHISHAVGEETDLAKAAAEVFGGL